MWWGTGHWALGTGMGSGLRPPGLIFRHLGFPKWAILGWLASEGLRIRFGLGILLVLIGTEQIMRLKAKRGRCLGGSGTEGSRYQED